MTKPKLKQAIKTAPSKHLAARVSYLHQAATYLMKQHTIAKNPEFPGSLGEPETIPKDNMKSKNFESSSDASPISSLGSQRRLISDLRSVALKSQMRLSQEMKRSICKKCEALLLTDFTSSSRTKNPSKRGRKTCANMLVIICLSCNEEKHFPIGAVKQNDKSHRGWRRGEKGEKKWVKVPEVEVHG